MTNILKSPQNRFPYRLFDASQPVPFFWCIMPPLDAVRQLRHASAYIPTLFSYGEKIMAKQSAPPAIRRTDARIFDPVAINLTMSRQAVELLRKHAGTARGHGKLLSQMIIDYDARQGFEDLLELATRELRKAIRDVAKEVKGEVRNKG